MAEEEKQPIITNPTVLTGDQMREPESTQIGTLVEQEPQQQPQQQSTGESVGMEQKINLLTQKAQIYIELLQDNTVIAEGDKFNGTIDQLEGTFNDPVTQKLYNNLKDCLAQLGDLYNMKDNVLIGTLSEYLNASQELIESLGDGEYEKEKKALDEGKCNPGDSDVDCKQKMAAAMERINTLKGKMLKIIEDKQSSMSQFDERKTQIADLSQFFTGLNFNPDNIDELITQANEKRSGLNPGEDEILANLISELERLKAKSEETNSQKEEENKLQEEAQKLEEELNRIGAEKISAETNLQVAEEEAKKAAEDGDVGQEEGDNNPPVTVESDSDQGSDQEVTNINRDAESSSGEESNQSRATSGDTIDTDEIEGKQPPDITSQQESKETVVAQTTGDESEKLNETVKQEGDNNPPVTSTEEPAKVQEETDVAQTTTGDGDVETTNKPVKEEETGIIPPGKTAKEMEELREEMKAEALAGVQEDIEGKKEQTLSKRKKKKRNMQDPPQLIQTGGRRRQSKKRRRKGKRKSKKNRH